MNNPEQWYVIKRPGGNCDIIPCQEIEGDNQVAETIEKWGLFSSQAEAIARRIGLIRAGKCEPV